MQYSSLVVLLTTLLLGGTGLARGESEDPSRFSSLLQENPARMGLPLAALPDGAMTGEWDNFVPVVLALADLNGDGIKDLILGGTSIDGWMVRIHAGSVRFLESRYGYSPDGEAVPPFDRRIVSVLVGSPFDRIIPADFNGDGHRDLLLFQKNSPWLHFLAGNGRGGFSGELRYQLERPVRSVTARDVGRRDGIEDLIIVSGEPEDSQFLISYGRYSHFFETSVTDSATGLLGPILIEDLDRDGFPDIVLSTEFGLRIYAGDSLDGDLSAVDLDLGEEVVEILLLEAPAGEYEPALRRLLAATGREAGVFEVLRNGQAYEVEWPLEVGRRGLSTVDNGSRPKVRRWASAAHSDIQFDVSPVYPDLLESVRGSQWAVITRLNQDATPDLVYLVAEGAPPMIQLGQPVRTFTVNTPGGGDPFPWGPDGVCDVDFQTPGEQCTWVEAVLEANTAETLDEIRFDIPEVETFGFSRLENPTIIDGSVDGDKVRINGIVSLVAPGSTLKNTIIPEGQNRIESDSLVVGNELGRTRIGANVTLGGLEPGSGNSVSTDALASALEVRGAALILGNQISCTFPLEECGPNSICSTGITVLHFADDAVIGGTAPGAGNSIEGCSAGILASSPFANSPLTGLQVLGNQIRQGGWGVFTDTFVDNPLIGGVSPAAGNIIQGNSRAGIYLNAPTGAISNNDISGNGGDGVFLFGPPIGPGQGVEITHNRIAGNGGAGVLSATSASPHSPQKYTVSQNSISDNGGLGIDWGNDGVTPNDEGDADTGPANLQNFPVLEKVPDTSNISGTLSSSADTSFQIEVFANDACDPSGHGEGQIFLDAFAVTTDGEGSAEFVLVAAPADKFITATATDPDGNTSEFSACADFAAMPEPDGFIVNSTGDGPDADFAMSPQGDPGKEGDRVCDTGNRIDVGGEMVAECTLRAAIQEANAAGEPGQIRFIEGLAGIQLRDPLDPVMVPLDLDGDGRIALLDLFFAASDEFGNRTAILTLLSNESRISGLTFSGISSGVGIRVFGDNNQIQNCRFPEDRDEELLFGVDLAASADENVIGGSRDAPVLPGNEGTCSDPCNFIAANVGIKILGSRNRVEGNQISSNGIAILIDFLGSTENQIGGPSPGQGNILDGGVHIRGFENRVQGNRIFMGDPAILIEGSHNQIGGPDPDEGNMIFANFRGVVAQDGAENNQILSNQIVRNTGPGIDLNGDGKTNLNDRGDRDEGANKGQNFPELRRAMRFENRIRVNGRLESDSEHAFYTIQIFSNANCNLTVEGEPEDEPEASGIFYGEGERLLASFETESNLVGNAFFARTFDAAKLAGDFLTATATNPEGNTSEFSRCILIQPDSDNDGTPDVDEQGGLGPDGQPRFPALDRNQNGIPDSEESRVVTQSVVGVVRGIGESALFTVEFSEDTLGLTSLFQPLDFPGGLAFSDGQVFPLDMIGIVTILESNVTVLDNKMSPSADDATQFSITLYPPDGMSATSYHNYGPTPDDPTDHFYEFLFDGSTGAEFLGDLIILHFVDGQRGDHDLLVNGQIETLGGPTIPGRHAYLAQLGDGTVGSIQFQTSLVLANTGGLSPVSLDLISTVGGFMNLELEGLGQGSLFNVGLLGGEAFSTASAGSGDIQVGFGRLIRADTVGGTAVFSRKDAATGTLLFESGVPAVLPMRDFTVFVDSTGDRDTGLAIVHPDKGSNGDEAFITYRLYDLDFHLLGTSEESLPADGHQARFITELFADVPGITEMQGTLTVESDQVLAAVTLRQNDIPGIEFPNEVPTLAAFPVIPGRADADQAAGGVETNTFFFPQVGDGVAGNIRFQTGIILVNAGEATDVTLEFFNSTGAPLSLDLGELGTGPNFNFRLGQGEALAVETPGRDAIQVGYARVTTSSSVGGTAVFSRSTADSGILLYEAGVAAAKALSDFSLVVDTRENRDIGLALVHPPADTVPAGADGMAHVVLRLYDQSFELLAENQLMLNPGEHFPRFVAELFPDVAEIASEMQGSLTVASDVPLAAVTLRQNDDPFRSFPEDVPTLTTFPVIPGRADPDPPRPECFLDGEIEDATLDGAVRALLDIPQGQIPCDLARQLTFLDVTGRGVESLAGLEQFDQLETLRAGNNQILDTTPLAGLQKLLNLSLFRNSLADVSPLAGLTQLLTLSLAQTPVIDLSPLAGMTLLEDLRIQSIQADDLTPLASLTRLQRLFIGSNSFSDISALGEMTQLETFNAFDNDISDLSPLQNLTQLRQLVLAENELSSTSALQNLTRLEELYLGTTTVSDVGFLEGLSKLRILDLSFNPVSEISALAQLSELEQLFLFDSQISDLSPLAGLTKLARLNLGINQIEDISPLSSLAGLEELYVGANSIFDISALANLSSLRILTLENNQIQDIAPLSGLTLLGELRLDRNQVSDLGALVQNPGIDQGDEVNVRLNPLDQGDCPAILQLQSRGVLLSHDLSCPQ